MMMHTMERYFTKDDDMDLTTDLAEAVLRSYLRMPEGIKIRRYGGHLSDGPWITCKPNCPSGLSSHPGYRGPEPALLPPQDDRTGRRWLRRSCFLYAS